MTETLHPDVDYAEPCVKVTKLRGFDAQQQEIWDDWCFKHHHWLNGAPTKLIFECWQ